MILKSTLQQSFIFLASILFCTAIDLYSTPPMGWSIINFVSDPNACIQQRKIRDGEILIEHISNALNSRNFCALGYRLVDLDLHWLSRSRDSSSSGKMKVDPFERGIKFLGDQLRINGIVPMVKITTSDSFVENDVVTISEWDIQAVTIDAWSLISPNENDYLSKFSDLFRQDDDPAYIACSGGFMTIDYENHPDRVNWTRILSACNSWRLFKDHEDIWYGITRQIDIMRNYDSLFYSLVGPGRFNDLGLLKVGDSRLTWEQQQSQMALWCLFASPLFFSVDIARSDDATLELLKNTRLIKINQDKGVRMPMFVGMSDEVQHWSRELFDLPNSWAIAVFNSGSQNKQIKFTLCKMLIRRNGMMPPLFKVTDVISGKEISDQMDLFTEIPVTLKPHQTVMYHVRHISTAAF